MPERIISGVGEKGKKEEALFPGMEAGEDGSVRMGP